VIGDKSGDLLSSRLVQEPGLIVDLMIEFAGRAKFIHVIRNPFDCISTMAARARAALDDAVHEFFRLCEANQIARKFVPREAWEDVYLEELIQRPHPVVADLCRFLGQEAHNSYLSACSELVFSSPRRSRDSVAWPSGLVREIEDRLLGFPWLRGYRFHESPFARARVEAGAARQETRPTELSLTLPS
jgi:hypothetical protein